MFSKSTERLRRNTALELTLRFALLFFLCSLALFATVDFLLARAQLEKDQQLISSFLESYQRLERQAGLHKLELVVERDTPYFQRSAMRVELFDHAKKPLMLAQPETWPDTSAVHEEEVGEGWKEAVFPNGGLRLLVRRIVLSDGSSLSIGKSVADRETELNRYRVIVLSVMVPLLGLGLLLTAYMNWRALRPVHDLIDTVRNLRASELNARVRVRNPRSELGELAQLFNQMLSQIEQLIIGMQHSLDAVAHDLRTPLARMRLSLESALASPENDILREALMDCAEESAQIETMLSTLMDISQAESGILSLHPQPLDLADQVAKSIDLYGYVAEDRGVRLTVETGEPIELTADPVRLRQVLGNLLDNAIKYSGQGDTVTVSWHSAGDQVVLTVKDEGIGIAPDKQSRVFERLYRADESRGEPGMGLGLSLVKAIVEAHRGEIRLSSEPGQGCCVEVLLPASA